MPTKTRKPKKKAAPKRAPAKASVKPTPKTAAPAKRKRKQPETFRAHSLTPSLTVSDLAASIRFYTDGLGFIIKERWETDGQLMGVMIEAGRCQLLLGQDDFAKGRDRVKGVGHRMWLSTLQKVDGLAQRAKAAGITLDHDVESQPWGSRAFALTDPDGFKLTIANDQ
jgi:uncharacterized glyoxalase superfamily protein PhnB